MPAAKMKLLLKWMLLLMTVCICAAAYTNEIEESDDDSIEEIKTHQKYKNAVVDPEDWIYTRQQVDRKRPDISEDAIFLPHEKYCQYFYAFDGTSTYIFKCASRYRFDAEKLQCLKSKSVNCGKRKKKADSSEEDEIGNEFKCPKWSGLHEHKYYCHLFYDCQSKKPFLKMCPPGMMFDNENKRCKHRQYVDCKKRHDPNGDDENDNNDPTSDTHDHTMICQNSAGVYPHPVFCNKFIRCWYGYGDVYTCPRGTLYDIDLMECRSRSNVKCRGTIDPYTYDDEDEPTLIDHFPDFECPVLQGRFSHFDCDKFYECMYGSSKLYLCPGGTLYDSEKRACKKESEVVCNKNIVDEEDEDFVCPAREGIYRDETDCGSYYKCKNSKAEHMQCPKGELFDAEWKSCNDEDEVTCGDRPLPGDDTDSEDNIVDDNPSYRCPKRHGRFTHDEICNWYYHCRDNMPSIRFCHGSQYYDSIRNICYNNVDCGRRKPKEDDETITPKVREFVCPSKNGKFSHPKNCGAFYVCKKRKYKLHHCPEGKLFDHKWKSCEPEQEVTCGERIHPALDPDEPQDKVLDPNPTFTCIESHGRFEHDDYCDWYYNCHDKKASLRECRRGKYYDKKKRKCIHFRDVSCEKRKKPEDRGVIEISSTIEQVVSTTQVPVFECPKKEGKFAHERDCSMFYHCKKGKHTIHRCPKNRLFDEERHSCEDAERVSCGHRIHPDMDPDEAQDEIIDPNPSFRCKSNHGRFTHDEYCHWYYHCHDKKSSIRQCKKGKYYDTRRKKCYDAKDVSCEGRRRPDDVDLTTEFITTEVSTTEPPEFQCPRKEGKFPHERDCGKFYDCKHGEYKIHKCPKNKLFDEERRSCEDDDHVSCGQRIHPDMDPDEPQDEIIDPNPNFRCKNNHGKFAHEEYCHWYYHCHDKKASVRQCKKGKYYDIRRKKCHNSKDVSCEGRQKPDEEEVTTELITREVSTTEVPKFQCPKKDGKFAHEKDCGKFYDCKHGEYKIHKCPKNKLFDEKERKCEDEDDVSCGQRIHPDMDPDEPRDKIVDPNPDFRCKSRHGKYTHDEFCHLYYKCHDKKASVRECQRGKYYDIKKKKCVNSKDVSCGKRKEPEETSTLQPETTTITFPETEETSETSIITSPPSTVSEQPTTTSTFPETETTSENSIITSPSATVTEVPTTTTPPRTVTKEPATSPPVSITDEPTAKPSVTTTEETATISLVTADEKPITTSHPITATKTSIQRINSTITTADEPSKTNPQMISTSPRPVSSELPKEITVSEHPRTTKGQPTVSAHTTAYEGSSKPPPSATESELQSTTQLPTDDGINPDKVVDPDPNYDCSGDEGNFPHEKYCHYYFSCKNNKATLRECPEGTYFDMMRGHCEEWYLVSCGDRLTREDVDSTFDDFQSTPFIPERRTISYPDLKTSKEPVSEKPSFQCPTEEGFYEHEKNCAKYYICKNKVPEIKTCPEGQLYDTEKRDCNEEQETNCGKRIHPIDDPDNPDKIPDKVIDPNPDFNCTYRHGCFSHELFCKWYYYCHDNRPEVRECAGDQYFDSVRNKCLDWWMVICDKRIVPEETTLLPITDTTKDQGTTSYGNKESGSTETNNVGTDFTNNWSREFSTTESNKKTEITSPDAKWTGGDRWTTKDWSKVPRFTDGTVGTDSGRWTTRDWSKRPWFTERSGATDSSWWTTRDWSRGPVFTDGTGLTDNGRWSTRDWSKRPWSTDRNGLTDHGRWTTGDWSKGPRFTDGTGGTDSGRWTTRDWSKRPWFTERSGATDSSWWTTRDWSRGPRFTDGTGLTDNGRWSTRDWSKRPWSTDRNGLTDHGRWTTGDWSKGPRFTDGTGGTDSGRWTTRDWSKRPWFTERSGGTDSGWWTTRDWSRGPRFTDGTGLTDNGRWSTRDWSKRPWSTDRNGLTDHGRWTTGDWSKGPRFTDGTGGTDSGKWTTRNWSKGSWPTDRSEGTDDGRWTTRDWSKGPWSTNRNGGTTEESRGTDNDEWTRASSKEIASTDITNFIITSTSVSTICEDDNENQPHETDCSLYFQCKNGVASIQKCPVGLLFNRIMKQCYREDWVDCDHRKRPEIGVTNDPTATEKPIEELCKEEDGDFHHPKDCRLYYTCRDGEYELHECPVGMLFDNAMRVCFDENRVNCGKRYRPQTTTQTPDDCDEWLRTLNTTVGTLATTPGSGTVSPVDKETGGTDSTDSRTSSSIDEDKNRSTQIDNHSKDSSSTTEISKSTITESENSGETDEKTVSSVSTLSTIQEDFKTQTGSDEASYSTFGLKSTTMTKDEDNSSKNIFTSATDKTEKNTVTGDDLSTISSLNTQEDKIRTDTASTKPSDNPENTKISTEDDVSNKGTTNDRRMTSEPEIGSTSDKNKGKTKTEIIPTTETGIVITEQTKSSSIPKTKSPVTSTNTDSEFKTSEISQNTGITSTAEIRTDISLETRDYTAASTAVSTDSGKGKEIIPTREGTPPSGFTDDKTGSDSAITITSDYNTDGSTPYGLSTSHHTTQHPCLTHTHSTEKPTVPPKTNCEKDDIDCITKVTGDVEKWYKCPKRQGNFPHPSTDRLFIFCRNWKPRVKKCAKNLVFSPVYMRCIRP